eukprot:CAMPEP_0197414662 /NCGR_PEP_ID=MMETSP1170-20131217/1354_1 /TAXON_ID=54406 /ORGANISM="Sarcinochrysis sp, Strain CCMP770" /LENGTH=66 /DNA_ID=CAMNT_0042941391 /DNA_START=75 /DNA_END=271 /DNA_ORIENTATION=-
MAIYLVALDAYAGAFFQDDIIRETRDSCRIWSAGGSPTSPKKFIDGSGTGPDEDDTIDECTKFSIR